MTTKVENRPVCILCNQRFSLAAGETTVCEDPRNDGLHIWRKHPIPPEDIAILNKARAVDTRMLDDEGKLTTPLVKDVPPISTVLSRAEPTPFDAAALRAGAPNPQMGFGI